MTLDEIVERLQGGLDKTDIAEVIKFDFGEDGVLSLVDGKVLQEDHEADCTVKLSRDTLTKLVDGSMNPMMGLAKGKVRVTGNMMLAMNLGEILRG